MKRALWIVGAAALAWSAWRGVEALRVIAPEDFVYYYAGTTAYWAGENPYDLEVYQARLRPLLGGENHLPSKDHAWLYPPAMAWLFGPFAGASPDPLTAFRAWSWALAFGAALLLWLVGRAGDGPQRLWLPAVLLACPAVDNAFFTHRVLWITVPAFVGGVALVARGRQRLGGAALALLGVQPQWWLVAAGCLAAGRRWSALAVAAGINAFIYAGYAVGLRPLEELTRYISNIGEVGGGALYTGNLSLAAGLYRLGLVARGADWAGVLTPGIAYSILFWVSVAVFAAGARELWRSRLDWEEKTLLTAAFAVWVQPYTHGSEALWLLPGFLVALRLAFADGAALACVGALAATGLLRVALDFPGGRGFVGTAYLIGVLALLWTARRRGSVALTSPAD